MFWEDNNEKHVDTEYFIRKPLLEYDQNKYLNQCLNQTNNCSFGFD